MYKMRGGSSAEGAREVGLRGSPEQRMMYNAGATSLAHINRKGGYTAKYLGKILVGVGR